MMDEEFEEEFYDPNAEIDKSARDAFLQRYYDEIFSALLSSPYVAETSDNELLPYEITVFSDQPGVLRSK